MPGVVVIPQWKPHPTHPTVAGYVVYAWIGHKALGEVLNTRKTFKGDGSKRRADKYAKELRAVVRNWRFA